MKYDDASWHYGGDFPEGLPQEAAATHTGMFLTWIALSGFAGEALEGILEENEYTALKSREVTPGRFFLNVCDGKFTDHDVAEELHEFVNQYFDFEAGSYLSDYEEVLASDLPSIYHVPDTWGSYEKIAPIIQQAYKKYKG